MTRTIIDVHVLQTVPPSNLNRDDTGSPKTAIYGGIRRARVSSQAWKRATRQAFGLLLDSSELGLRTRQVVELLGERIRTANPALDAEADGHAKAVLERAGFKLKPARTKGRPDEAEFLLFLSERQIEALTSVAVEAAAADGSFKDALAKYDVKGLADQEHSIDIALFGRMVASLPELNVDAAAQVAHAISVHAVETEFDYFTAVDDNKTTEDDAGAGMIGTVEFNSATLYRYATVDVDRLQDNLGSAEATRRAVGAFVEAFLTSMPTGKQNTFANRTLPDAVLVTVGSRQPVNLVGAFEEPVTTAFGGRPSQAAQALAEHADDVYRTYGLTHDAAWVVGVGEAGKALSGIGSPVSIAELTEQLTTTVAERIPSSI